LLGLEKLILESKPHAILVGPFRSEALLAGMDILAKHKVPMLVTIAMSPASGQKIKKNPEKYKYIFRVSSNAKYLVGLLLGSMKQLKDKFGFDKVYIMNQDVLWARGVSGAMNKLLPKQGWKVMGHDEFPTGASKFGPALTKVKIKGVQVIFTCFDMPQSGILVKQWKGMKVPSIMAGFISPMSGSAAWKTFNGNIGGFINSHFEIGNISSEKYKPATRFFDAYEKKYGKQIQAGHSPSSSYDAVYILKEAIEKTNSLNPDALVAALEKTDYTGASGKIKFDDEHQAVFGSDPTKTGAGCLFQWNEDGSRSIIYPPEVAEAEVKLPPWMKAVK
jgi:branched-chain amino acid transport system substrate-binding protein